MLDLCIWFLVCSLRSQILSSFFSKVPKHVSFQNSLQQIFSFPPPKISSLIPIYLVAFVSLESCSRASYHDENQCVDFQCLIVMSCNDVSMPCFKSPGVALDLNAVRMAMSECFWQKAVCTEKLKHLTSLCQLALQQLDDEGQADEAECISTTFGSHAALSNNDSSLQSIQITWQCLVWNVTKSQVLHC